MAGGGRYAFGDDEGAARRLEHLARMHEPLTRVFVEAHAPHEPEVAVDLGCGPGHTTALLAEVVRAGRTVGLDASAAYVELAEQSYPALEFRLHDVTQLPLPVPPAQLLYARFLLAHLPDPAERLTQWVDALAPGGLLLVEEGERMESSHQACARYLDIVRETFAADAKLLFPGPALAEVGDAPGRRVRHAGTVELRESARHFAELFLPNLARWGPRAVELGTATERDLQRLQVGLEGLLGGGGSGSVVSVVRQVVIERAGG